MPLRRVWSFLSAFNEKIMKSVVWLFRLFVCTSDTALTLLVGHPAWKGIRPVKKLDVGLLVVMI